LYNVQGMELGRIGIWSAALRNAERGQAARAAAELEQLGYGALWFPGGPREGVTEHISALHEATQRVAIATGILSIWTHSPADVTRDYWDWEQRFPGRFLLGIGISHQHVVERAGLAYEKPLRKLRGYLDELDAQPKPVPIDRRCIASLGPKSLELARERSWGTHPYFVPVSHTKIAREAVGPGKLVAPELMVVLETDPDKARAMARQHMAMYLTSPNYATNLLRLGYSQQDLDNGGSDRIVDDIVAWGSPRKILERVQEHHAAGADHVCVQVLNQDRRAPALEEWRTLAQTFF
jgi:probable F420-dependent oxidoreductase